METIREASYENDPSDLIAKEVTDDKHTTLKKVDIIAKRETKVVRRLRITVLIVLVCSAAIVAWGVFWYTHKSQQDTFKQNFHSSANKVMSAMGLTLDQTLSAMDSLVVTIVSFAKYSNSSWPFVTLPDFSTHAAKIRSLSRAVYLNQYLFVTRQQRGNWQDYASKHNSWVDESITIQSSDQNHEGPLTVHGPVINNYTALYEIYDNDLNPMNQSDYYIPTWQSAPVVPSVPTYNWDLLCVPDRRATDVNMATHKAVISPASHLPDPNDADAVRASQYDVEFYANFVPPGQDPSEPASDVRYPILDSIKEITVKDPRNKTFVGLFSITLYWRNMIEDILPPGNNGLIIVFANECNPSFTFQINGPKAAYLGRGDLHDSEYNDMVESAWLHDLDTLSTKGSTYSGIPLDREFCPFRVRLYPSHVMENSYTSNQPVVLTIAAASIFLFTSLVFIFYDQMVEYRQKQVMKTAVKSSAIVSSLFPSTVRDRLFETSSEIPKTMMSSDDKMLKAFFEGKSGSMVDGVGKSAPIADLFHNTTIFFADLAGFTKWSSSRTPTDVFVLLETLYGTFDACATKRGVFKVETVGDCYVAVTGLPEPQKKHAVIMAQFAHDCLLQMSFLVNELAKKLGEDTRILALRVGLHSGSTTAGVLRGLKGRFQLFGDTVNTASRMETTGAPGRIHISQATADELVLHGKGHWITPREDPVFVKGKGEMKTYYVAIKSRETTGSSQTKSIVSDDDDNGGADNGVNTMNEDSVLAEKLAYRLSQNLSGVTPS